MFVSDLPGYHDAKDEKAKPLSRAEKVARIATRQVESRMRRVDQWMRQIQAGCAEAPGSDWRLLELYLQKINEDVLIFQRGDKDDKRFYPEGVVDVGTL